MPPSAGPIDCIRFAGHGPAGWSGAASVAAMLPDCPHSDGGAIVRFGDQSHECPLIGMVGRPLMPRRALTVVAMTAMPEALTASLDHDDLVLRLAVALGTARR